MAGEEHSASKGWFCLICDESPEYRTESDLSAHYLQDHAEFVTVDQMQTLLDSSLLSLSSPPTCCPLCGPSKDHPSEARPPDWDHIAEHVHTFALLSLPWGAASCEPQGLNEAHERISAWLRSDAQPMEGVFEEHALPIGTLDTAKLSFKEEPYFADSRGMQTAPSISSIQSDRGPQGLGSSSPLLFPDTNLLETFDAATSDESKDGKKIVEPRSIASTPYWLNKNREGEFDTTETLAYSDAVKLRDITCISSSWIGASKPYSHCVSQYSDVSMATWSKRGRSCSTSGPQRTSFGCSKVYTRAACQLFRSYRILCHRPYAEVSPVAWQGFGKTRYRKQICRRRISRGYLRFVLLAYGYAADLRKLCGGSHPGRG